MLKLKVMRMTEIEEKIARRKEIKESFSVREKMEIDVAFKLL